MVVADRFYIDQTAIGKVDRECDIVQREFRRAVHDRGLRGAPDVGGEPEEHWANVGIFRHQRIIVTIVCRLDTIRAVRVNRLLEAAASNRGGNIPARVGAGIGKLAIGLRLDRGSIGFQGAIGEEGSGTLRAYWRRKCNKFGARTSNSSTAQACHTKGGRSSPYRATGRVRLRVRLDAREITLRLNELQ